MSVVPKESIQVIAQSIGINNLSPDVLEALAPDVEYRVREIMQEAIKCMRHSRRTILMSDDVDSALNLRNVEPLYGVASENSLQIKRAAGLEDLFYVDDKDVDFKDVIEAPLPKAPLDTAVVAHWLAIEGVQPAIPENVPIEALTAPADNRRLDFKEDGLPIDVKLPIKHVLSRELQLYFDKIVELTVSKSDSTLFKEALVSLATDSGLHPLVPYFTYFVADEVSRNLNNLPLLFALMRVVWSLLQNPHLHIEPYLHQLMPSVITCLVAKRLGNRLSDNHWELRSFTASLIASICKRFGHAYHNLQPRITRTLLHAFLDPTKALPQHYGAIKGIAALGPSVVRVLILPNLGPYMQLLEPEMQLEKQKNEIKRLEAWRVYEALLHAAGLCLHNRLKIFPWVPSPSTHSILKSGVKIVTAITKKRKTSTDNLMQHPPLKKVAMEVPLNSSLPAEIVEGGTIGAFSSCSIRPPPTMGSTPRLVSNGSLGGTGRGIEAEGGGGGGGVLPPKKASPTPTPPPVLKDLDAHHLFVSLFDYFGESMFPFTSTPEASFFL